MNSESSLVFEVWELVRDQLAPNRRSDTAISLLRAFEEFGFEGNDLTDVLEEDEHLTAAHKVVFGGEDEDVEEDESDEW